ncbi:hypothetical protein AURDEDRAFT_170863 [Auricularia subglabra TFB-10046 SS5]|nr:hypothetical protein AURDEDRAFT_170863 [Auricularia subglabra TFB-10046 SS5]
MNVSFDDTSAYITFSPEWRVQPPDDPTRASSWQSTYHASQSAGASAKLTFNGAGVYLYGSKGPGHASNHSVRGSACANSDWSWACSAAEVGTRLLCSFTGGRARY